MSNNRSFTVVHVETHSGRVKSAHNLGGRYISSSAAGAARKAATQICRISKTKGQCTLDITLRETTRGSKGKEYKYAVKRILDPTTVVRDGVEITFRYRTEVAAL